MTWSIPVHAAISSLTRFGQHLRIQSLVKSRLSLSYLKKPTRHKACRPIQYHQAIYHAISLHSNSKYGEYDGANSNCESSMRRFGFVSLSTQDPVGSNTKNGKQGEADGNCESFSIKALSHGFGVLKT